MARWRDIDFSHARGKVIPAAKLAPYTWLRVGGPADYLFLPKDEADLALVLAQKPADMPVLVMGAGSNLLVRDGGIAGLVVRLGPAFGKCEVVGETGIRAGSAVLDRKLAKFAAENGIAGLSFYAGIPGTIGGALRMNAGCYDGETKDVVKEIVAIDGMGRRIVADVAEMNYAYRHCGAPNDWIFVEARFEGEAGDPDMIRVEMDEITARREASQPIREKTGGSTFKNPEGHKSWQLIDAAGGRGLMVGDAQMSEQHCNFMINRGAASAADLEGLGEEIRRRVRANSDVDLHWEIKRVGEMAQAEADT